MNVVVSQPMLFPWVGMLEQIRLANVYVYYSDVQYVKGFINRVQIKLPDGVKWMTVPLSDFSRGQKINEIKICSQKDWHRQHLSMLTHAYRRAPFFEEMIKLVESVYASEYANIGMLARASTDALCNYFGLDRSCRFVDVETLMVGGSSSRRLIDIVKKLNGDCYITGLGARNYLDHALFESTGLKVRYMDYQKRPYPQLYGEFTPFVSSLDIIANCGQAGIKYICSESIDWRTFINE